MAADDAQCPPYPHVYHVLEVKFYMSLSCHLPFPQLS